MVLREDIYFYLDLTKNYLRKKDIVKIIENYIKEKNQVNPNSAYTLLLFLEDGTPIFVNDENNCEKLLNTISENWENRSQKASYFENGLFYISSHIADTIRKKSKNNRVIIISDTPSDLSEDYVDALLELVSKIKYFPTFIDIIRISPKNMRFFKDDVKLNLLASETQGSILEDYLFYSKLAKKLKDPEENDEELKCYFCKDEFCPVCADLNDKIKICKDCNSGFHECCIINYALGHNIGIPHIFRCPNCDTLLQIDQNAIISTNKANENVDDYLNIDNLANMENSNDEKVEVNEKIQLEIQNETEKEFKSVELDEKQEIKDTIVNADFGKFFVVKKIGDQIVYEKVNLGKKNNLIKDQTKKESKIGLTNSTSGKEELKVWRPKNLKNQQEKKEIKVIICPECGNPIKMTQSRKMCPICGACLDN
ncbi:MAG: hypothetical protein ACTSSM_10935 [Promethearchaeota archaeon]